VQRVVIAAQEPRAGAAGSAMNVLQNTKLNHQCDVVVGVMQEQSSALLKAFFKARR
jgi:tRNA(adenine34) deaminase